MGGCRATGEVKEVRGQNRVADDLAGDLTGDWVVCWAAPPLSFPCRKKNYAKHESAGGSPHNHFHIKQMRRNTVSPRRGCRSLGAGGGAGKASLGPPV